MNRLAVATLVLLATVSQVAVATAQAPPPITPPPPPMSAPPPSLPPVSAPGPATPTNLQPLPWFVRPYNMPGMPFYRLPAPPPQRSCRVVSWHQAQFWSTDEWGNTVTWVGYQPQYACN